MSTFAPNKVCNLENGSSCSNAICGMIVIFKSLSFNYDLKGFNLINQAVSKLPPNFKETWSMHAVKHNWQRPRLLDSYKWPKQNAKVHKRYLVFAANTNISKRIQDKTKFPPCVLHKDSQVL